jgi:membrane complex biogenesis BtpA family protein
MDEVLERAAADAEALDGAGFDAVVVENFGDVPFHPGPVPPETVAAMTLAVDAVRAVMDRPAGVNVLRNDAASALGIAAATGACFVRVNVHVGSMWTDQGLVQGRAAETLRRRSGLAPGVAILADVHVKHAVPPAGADLGSSARDAWHRGLADALLVTGASTGAGTRPEDVALVRAAVPEAPVVVASGVTPENAKQVLSVADGVIVGSALMHDGRAGAGIDPERARAFVERARN